MTVNIARYLGLANEDGYAENPAPAAGFHVDIASASLDVPTDVQMFYGGGLSRNAKTHRPGFYAPSGNIVYAFDIRTITFLLRWALGEYEFTEGIGEEHNTHEIWGTPNSLLPSFCARVGKDIFEHVFSGCCINTLTLAIDGEYCMATADIIAAVDKKDTLKDITDLILPDEYPLAFYEVSAMVDDDGDPETDNEISAKVKSLTLAITNNLSADGGRRLGSRHPRALPAGERTVTISKSLEYDSTDALEKYWGGAEGPGILGATEFSLDLFFDSGDHGGMLLQMPKVVYSQVQTQPSGRAELTQSTTARALIDEMTLADGTTEVNTELLATIENDQGDINPPPPE